MPVISRLRIDELGLDVDADTIENVERETEYNEAYYVDFILSKPSIAHSKTIIYFKNGSRLELGPYVMGTIVRSVELVEGRIYQISKDGGDKWLGLCRRNSKGNLKIYPLDKSRTSFSADDKHKYEFHKEFDLDLKEYL